MKGIRGLLEKDFRLFFRQGSNLFLVLVVLALFFILRGKTGATFIAMYIPSVMAVYSGNTISYDENEHGYTYLFSLPVNKKIYVREKYMFSFIMTVFGWGIGVICAGIAVFIKPGEVFDLEMLAMELITIFVFQAIAGIVIAIRLRFAGEKGRFVLPIAVLIVFASCYIIGSFVRANSGLKESISYMIGETGDFEIAISLIVLSLLVWFASYKYSMRVMKIIRTQTQSILIFPEGSHNYDLNRLIKPLYDGPVNLALKNGKKIVPVALVFDFLKKR